MDGIVHRVKDSLRIRKNKLSAEDIFARDFTGMPNNMIYDEVRIQFWVVKMFIVGPLNRKLYMHFVKDVKDRTMHLASEENIITCEGELEKSLQEVLLCEKSSNRYTRRTEEELMQHFNFASNREEILDKLTKARRTETYVVLALEGVTKLRTAMSKISGGVDFLMRLDITGVTGNL